MSLKSYLKRLLCANSQKDISPNQNPTVQPITEPPPAISPLSAIFQTVYGRLPDNAELESLTHLSHDLAPEDQAGLFRATINAFDHQKTSTPFTVRFGKDDMRYAKFEDFELAIDAKDISVSIPLFHGHYEQHLVKFFNETLKPGMVFMDIGANVGFYSMLAASKVGSSGKVISFDPNTENCRLIMLSMYKNQFQNIELYPFALGDKTGHALFSTHIGSNGGLIADTEASLLNPNCTVVPMTQLDNLIQEKVDVIKIDVEGAEGLVINGGKALIEHHRPIITSEFSLEMLSRVSRMSGKDYLCYFRDQHYAIYVCDRNTHELVVVPDVETFVDNYGEQTRIEDLVLIPN